MKERTFCMIKPDAIQRGYMGQIIQELEAAFNINQMVLARVYPSLAMALYAEHDGKDFYDGLIEHTTSGPVVLMELEAEDAVNKLRTMMGASDPSKASKGTLRAVYGVGMPNNAIHGSADLKAAKRELSLMGFE